MKWSLVMFTGACLCDASLVLLCTSTDCTGFPSFDSAFILRSLFNNSICGAWMMFASCHSRAWPLYVAAPAAFAAAMFSAVTCTGEAEPSMPPLGLGLLFRYVLLTLPCANAWLVPRFMWI